MARLRDQASRLEIASYPLVIDVPAAFADIDSFQHVNNVAIARYFEEGRAQLNMKIFGEDAVARPSPGVQLLFASVLIEYLAQGRYPGVFQLGSAISKVGGSSFVQCGGLFQDGLCVAISETVTVCAIDGRSQPLSAEIKPGLEAWAFKGALD